MGEDIIIQLRSPLWGKEVADGLHEAIWRKWGPWVANPLDRQSQYLYNSAGKFEIACKYIIWLFYPLPSAGFGRWSAQIETQEFKFDQQYNSVRIRVKVPLVHSWSYGIFYEESREELIGYEDVILSSAHGALRKVLEEVAEVIATLPAG